MADSKRNRPDDPDDAYAPKPREGGDPLAELARLIGQSDPFTELGRPAARKPLESFRTDDRPAPEWLARPAAPEEHDYDDPRPAPRYEAPASYRAPAPSFAPEQRYAPEERYAPAHDQTAHEPYPEDDQAQYADVEHDGAHAPEHRGDDRYRVTPPLPGEYEPDSYYSDDGHMPPQGDDGYAPSRRRGGLVTILAVLGLAVIGTAGAFGYRAFTSPRAASDVVVIKADPKPMKDIPAASADAQSKPFQERIGAPPAERIVPREEQPVSLPVAPRAAAPVPPTAFAPPNPPPLAAPSGGIPLAAANEPKRVRTMTIRPDQANADAAPPPPSAGATARAPAAKQSGSAPLTIAPPPDSAPRTKVAARPTPAVPSAPAASGAYVVQVSAQKTEEEAQSSYRSLQQKYPGVLGGREPSIRRADLGDKGVYYRAQVGPFATADQANNFCGNLKAAGGQCIVQKN